MNVGRPVSECEANVWRNVHHSSIVAWSSGFIMKLLPSICNSLLGATKEEEEEVREERWEEQRIERRRREEEEKRVVMDEMIITGYHGNEKGEG